MLGEEEQSHGMHVGSYGLVRGHGQLAVGGAVPAVKAPPKEFAGLYAAAMASIKTQEPFKPLPVQEIALIWDGYPTRWGTGAGCIYICAWHYCLFCCITSGCWIELRKPDVVM